jgi:hypothetical protein
VPLVVRAERLTPSTYHGIITKDVLSLRSSFMKGDGVGARVILDKAGLNIDGRLFVSLTIIELPLVKYEFPPLPLYALSSESSVNRELLKLRTPLSLSLSTMKELVVLGDSLSISGRVSPPAGGIKIDLVARKLGGYWFTATSTLTAPDGSFAMSWSPTEAGEYEMRAYHAGGEYTTEAWSDTVKARILRPAEFRVTDLSISPREVRPGEKATVSVKVTNMGEASGSYTVELKVAGVTVDSKTITLAGGESTTLMFEWTGEKAGIYDVDVAGLRGSINVVPLMPPSPPLAMYTSAILVAVAGVITVAIIMWRRLAPRRYG